MFTRLLTLFCLICLPLSARAAPSTTAYDRVIASGTIRCGYFGWPPYLMKDPNTGAMSGINYDYMMEIGRVLGLKIEWVEETSAGDVIAGLDAGRFDVMCSSLWPDAARMKNSLLTDPTFYSTVYAIVRASDTRFDNGKAPIDNAGVSIASLEGDVTYFLAQEKFPRAKIYALPQMADGVQLLQSVAAKKADVTLADKGILADFNRTNHNALKLVAGQGPVRVFPECLGVRRGEVELKMLLDTAIRTINDRGRPAEFIKHYPGSEFYAPVPGWTPLPR